MKAFRCDRCKKYGLRSDKETLRGGQIVKEAFKLSHRRPEWDGRLAYKAMKIYPVYVEKVDLCLLCAASLVELLQAWWNPTETMVEFVDIEDSFEGIDELDEFGDR